MAVKDWKRLASLNTTIGDSGTGGPISFPPNAPTANVDDAIRSLRAEAAEYRDKDAINANHYIAADGVTDDTAAWRALLTDAEAQQRYVIRFRGISRVSDPDLSGQCLRFNSKIRLFGEGMYSAIWPMASVPSTTPIIRVAQDAVYADDFGGIYNVFLGNPNASSSAGGTRLLIDCSQPFSYLAFYEIRGCYFQNGASGWGVHVLNSVAHVYLPFTAGNSTLGSATAGTTINGLTSGATGTLIAAPVADSGSFAAGTAAGALQVTVTSGAFLPSETIRVGGTNAATANGATTPINVQGGVALMRISHSAFSAPIRLENSGDNVVIEHCSATTRGLLDAQPIRGASHLAVRDCTAFSGVGAPIIIRNAVRFYIENNNIECIAGSGTDDAVLRVICDPAIQGGGVIAKNLIAAIGTSNPQHLIRITGANGVNIAQNTFATGGQYTPSFVVRNESGGPMNFSPAQVYVNIASAARVCYDDNGGTSGVPKALGLGGGWSAVTGRTVRVYKSNGRVHLIGRITGGTGSPFTLPAGLRPSQDVEIPVLSLNPASDIVACFVRILTDGTVTIVGGSNNAVCLDDVSFIASDLSNATGTL